MRILAGSIAALLASHTAHATSATWTGANGALWSNVGNWTNGIPGYGDTATFNSAGNGNTVINLGAGLGITSLVFDTASAAAYTIGTGAVNSQTFTLYDITNITMTDSVTKNTLINSAIALYDSSSLFYFTNNSTTNSLTFAGKIASGPNSNAGTKTMAVGGTGNVTFGGTIAQGGPSTIALTKFGTGTVFLPAAYTYTNTTTVNGGLLQLTGRLNGATGTPLTFGGTGILNVNEAAGATQGMGILTFSAGDGTVQNTYTNTSARLTFSNVAARTAGATANFTTVGGTNGTTNRIVLTQFNGAAPIAGTLLNKGLFFGGGSYATYAAGGFVRAYTTSDTNAAIAAAGASTIANVATNNVFVTGPITAQAAAAVNTLNLGANSVALSAAGTILKTNGVLTAGGSLDNGILQPTAAGGEIVVRVDSGATTLSSIIQNNTSASSLTKSGPGALILSAANTLTGGVTLNSGTLNINHPQALGPSGKLTIAGGTIGNTSGGAIVSSNNSSQDWTGDVTFAGTQSLNLGTGRVSLKNGTRTVNVAAGSLSFGGGYAVTPSNLVNTNFGLTKTGAGTLILAGTGSAYFSGTGYNGLMTLSAGTLLVTGGFFHSNTIVSGGVLQAGATGSSLTSPWSNFPIIFGADSNGTFQLNGNSVFVAGLGTHASSPGTPVIENGAAGNAILTIQGAPNSAKIGRAHV